MTAVEKTCSMMRTKLGSGAWLEGQKLPSLDTLAVECKVSRSTMWQALARLKKESLIHTRRGGKIIAGSSAISQVTGQDIKGPVWQQLKDKIGREVLIGTEWGNGLPPISKVAKQYGVAINTCRKALDELVNERMLDREGRRYRKALGRAIRYQPAIFLISAGDIDSGISIVEPRTEHVVESFERECFRLGFLSRCEGFDAGDPSILIKLRARLKKTDPVAGYILNLWYPGTGPKWNRWIDLIQSLTHEGKPAIVLDLEGGLVFPNMLLGHPQFRVLRIAGERAGEIMGQMLLNYGHHAIAYLMPFAKWAWARNRLAGLEKCYRAYGEAKASVEVHSLDENVDSNFLFLAALGLNEREVRNLYRERFTAEYLEQISACLGKKPWSGIWEKIRDKPKGRSTNAFARFMLGLAGQSPDPAILESLYQILGHISSNIARDLYLEPFIETVLRKSSATAWVCADDFTALSAVEFLRRKGKRVPEDISVVGFENYRESHEHQLSTFDFNMNGMIQQSLRLIMDEKYLKSQPVIKEVDGYVVERRTTRTR